MLWKVDQELREDENSEEGDLRLIEIYCFGLCLERKRQSVMNLNKDCSSPCKWRENSFKIAGNTVNRHYRLEYQIRCQTRITPEEWKTNLMSTKRQSTSHQTYTTIHRKLKLTLNHPSLQNKTTDVVIQQHSRKLLMMDILVSETCWAHKKWNKIARDIKLVFHSSTILYDIWTICIRAYTETVMLRESRCPDANVDGRTRRNQ